MLPDGTIPGSLADLLVAFRSCFTTPTFTTFSAMMVGLIAQTRRRTVCGMLLGVGLQRCWHHARAHRLFATARWCADAVGLALLDLIVERLLPKGSPITVVAMTPCSNGRAARCSACSGITTAPPKAPSRSGWSNCWVVAGIVVDPPFLARPVCLPVL